MTENEYINLTDLQRVTDAKWILSQLNHQSNTCIHPTEWKEMYAKLTEWQNAMQKKVKTR
jgi:hypothetical protein